MTDLRPASWRHYTLLIAALSAGTLATRFVPAYEDHVGTVTYPSRAAASRADSANETASGYSQTEYQRPKLNPARGSS